MKNENFEYLKMQTIDLQNKYGGLFSEIEIPEDEYLLVQFCYNKEFNGIEFSADFAEPVHFSDDVIRLHPEGNYFVIKFNEYFDDLNYYIEQISDEISEGYILPNDLYVDE